MFLFFIISLIIFGRIDSSLLGLELLNPDEAQMASNAIGILSRNFDINYFDGNSSGILNSIILTWPRFFGLDITYFTTRITSIILIGLIIYYTFRIINKYFNYFHAVVFILPIIFFFSFTKDPDFLHYSSEQLSTFLLIFSYWLFISCQEKNNNFFYLIPIFLSMIFFSKIQFAPAACIFMGVILIDLYFKKVSKIKIFYYFTIFLIIPLTILLNYYFTDNLKDFVINNYYYPKDYILEMKSPTPAINVQNISLNNAFVYEKNFFNHLVYNSVFHYIYIYIIYFLIFLKQNFSIKNFKKIFNKKFFFLVIIIISIIFCILLPGRNFRHYLIPFLPFVPIFFSKTIYIISNKNSLNNLHIFLLLFIIFTTSLLFEEKKFYSHKFKYTKFDSKIFGYKNPKVFNYLELNEDKTIYIWGWMPQWYLLSGLNPASRSTNSEKLIEDNNFKDYYKNRLIKDFVKKKPNLIIDYVRNKSFKLTQAHDRIDNFIQLKSVLQATYYKIPSYDSNCPTFYLHNKDLEKFNEKNIQYILNKKNSKIIKINDFSVTEDVCDDAIIFNKTDEEEFKINFSNKENLYKVMILSSKKNIKESFVLFKFLDNEKIIKEQIIKLKKHPYWSEIKFDKSLKINSVIINVEDLIKKNNGINEIKFYRN